MKAAFENHCTVFFGKKSFAGFLSAEVTITHSDNDVSVQELTFIITFPNKIIPTDIVEPISQITVNN